MFRDWFCLAALAGALLAGAAAAQEKTPQTADRHQKLGIACEACHGEAQPKTAADAQACLRCHKSIEAVAEAAKDFKPNPHDNHITQSSDLACTECHHGHKPDSPMCLRCHEAMRFDRNPRAQSGAMPPRSAALHGEALWRMTAP